MGFQKVQQFNLLNQIVEGSVDNVQSGLLTFSSGLTINQSITAVVDNKAWIEYSYYSQDTIDDPENILVMGRLTSTTNIQFERKFTGNTIFISWFVVEYKATAPVTIERGLFTGSFGTFTDITINSVDKTKAWPEINYCTPGVTWADEDFVRGRLQTSTVLRLGQKGTTDAGFECAWQIIEHLDYDVTEYRFTTDNTSTSYKETITAIDLTETMLRGSARCETVGDVPNGREMPVHGLFSTTQIEVLRSLPTYDINYVTYVVEGHGDFISHQFVNTLTGTFANQNIGSIVDTARVLLTVQSSVKSIVSNTEGTSLVGEVICQRLNIIDNDEYRFQRNSSTDEIQAYNNEIEFIPA